MSRNAVRFPFVLGSPFFPFAQPAGGPVLPTRSPISIKAVTKLEFSPQAGSRLTGEFTDVLLAGNDASKLGFDALTRKQLTAPVTVARFGANANAPSIPV